MYSNITGVDRNRVVTVWDILLEKVDPGLHIVVFDITRRWPGLGTAEFLVNRGLKVEIVTPGFYVGEQLEPSNVCLSYQRILDKDVTLIPNTEIKEVRDSSVIIANVYTQKSEYIQDVDTVVMSVGNESIKELYDELKDDTPELYRIGDALAPRLIQQAILDAEELGRRI